MANKQVRATPVLSHLMIAVVAQAHGRSKLAAYHLAQAATEPGLDKELQVMHAFAQGEQMDDQMPQQDQGRQQQANGEMDDAGDLGDQDMESSDEGFEQSDVEDDGEQDDGEQDEDSTEESSTDDEFDRMENELNKAEPQTNMRGGDNQEAARARRITSNILQAHNRIVKAKLPQPAARRRVR